MKGAPHTTAAARAAALSSGERRHAATAALARGLQRLALVAAAALAAAAAMTAAAAAASARAPAAATAAAGASAPARAFAGPASAPASTPAAAAACPPPPDPSPDQVRAAAAQRRDRGVLWRLEKDGHASYLYGTLHVGRLAWLFPGPQVGQAIERAQVLALELDVGDPGVVRALGEATRQLPPAPRPDARLAQRLAAQARAACIDPAALGDAPALLQVITLSVAQARREGLEAAFGQELALGALFRAQGKPVVSLETAQQQLQALTAIAPEEAARATEQALDALEDGRSATTLHRLAQAWESGQLQELATYEQWCQCIDGEADRAWMRRLNDDRNPALADGIDALHREGRRVFAAVGALHMTGAQGLPALMQRRGYQVQRVHLDAPAPM